jgi:hypothetical protein
MDTTPACVDQGTIFNNPRQCIDSREPRLFGANLDLHTFGTQMRRLSAFPHAAPTGFGQGWQRSGPKKPVRSTANGIRTAAARHLIYHQLPARLPWRDRAHCHDSQESYKILQRSTGHVLRVLWVWRGQHVSSTTTFCEQNGLPTSQDLTLDTQLSFSSNPILGNPSRDNRRRGGGGLTWSTAIAGSSTTGTGAGAGAPCGKANC